ncbi:MAG: DNA translocase FtsK [Candidatus Metalachnospira sp.]|nr:DNA translocase FtsK [Candidatus Metalachnospira sp.]
MAEKKSAAKNGTRKTKTAPKKSAAKKTASKSSSKKYKVKRSSNTKGRNARNKNTIDDGTKDEVIALIVIAISAVALISLITDSIGVVGQVISGVLKGLLGISAYFLPFIVIVFCVWRLFSEKRDNLRIRIAASALFLVALASFAYALSTDGYEAISVYKLYENGGAANGGAVGGVIGGVLLKYFDNLGAYIILTVMLIVAVVLATGISFFDGVSNAAKYVGDSGQRREDRLQGRAEQDKIKQAERELKQSEQIQRARKRKEVFNILMDKEDFDAARDGQDVDDEEVIMPDNEDVQEFPEGMLPSDYMVRNIARHNGTAVPEMDIKNTGENTKIDFNKESGIQSVISDCDGFEDNLDVSTESGNNENIEFEINSNNNPLEKSNEEEKLTVNDKSYDAIGTDAINVDKDYSHLDSNIIGGAIYTAEEMKTVMGLDNSKAEEVPSKPLKPLVRYIFPPMNLLGKDVSVGDRESKSEMLATARKLEDTLKSFGVDAKVLQINRGPTVTRYELSPSQGVKVSKIVNLSDDIALNLAASGIRIEAPIPGKAAVGIEVPNKNARSVFLRTVLESDEFKNFPSKLAFALGQDIAGNPVVTDIDKMPHLLIAGATGSGKSVCINTIITSIIYKAKPDEVKLLLVDPKVVELSVYNGIPHLLIPVVTDPKKAAGALNWAVREMLARYNDFAEHSVRDIKGFNRMKAEKGETELMPQIVIIIDELADLMMAAPGEVEDSICRLAQMARAAGIHLIIATQRPSVDVITGVIKANIPSRLAFAVSSGIDSRTILDSVGAEKLLGKGDMLFYPVGMNKPVRIQGAFVTDKEVENIVDFLKEHRNADYNAAVMDEISSSVKTAGSDTERDEYHERAIELVVGKEKASVSMLQRQFRIGYNRAARIMDELEATGIVGPEDGSKPRKVLMSQSEYDTYKNGSGE